MLLSYRELLAAIESGEVLVDPRPSNDSIQPASIDLRLDYTIQVQSDTPIPGISLDPEALNVSSHLEAYSREEDISGGRIFKFAPRQFVIGQTLEMVGLPNSLAGRVEGRSRLARLGVGVHITAPKIDPGFNNRITLEIYNLDPWTIELTGGMQICTLLLERLSSPAQSGYQGMFQGPQ